MGNFSAAKKHHRRAISFYVEHIGFHSWILARWICVCEYLWYNKITRKFSHQHTRTSPNDGAAFLVESSIFRNNQFRTFPHQHSDVLDGCMSTMCRTVPRRPTHWHIFHSSLFSFFSVDSKAHRWSRSKLSPLFPIHLLKSFRRRSQPPIGRRGTVEVFWHAAKKVIGVIWWKLIEGISSLFRRAQKADGEF